MSSDKRDGSNTCNCCITFALRCICVGAHLCAVRLTGVYIAPTKSTEMSLTTGTQVRHRGPKARYESEFVSCINVQCSGKIRRKRLLKAPLCKCGAVWQLSDTEEEDQDHTSGATQSKARPTSPPWRQDPQQLPEEQHSEDSSDEWGGWKASKSEPVGKLGTWTKLAKGQKISSPFASEDAPVSKGPAQPSSQCVKECTAPADMEPHDSKSEEEPENLGIMTPPVIPSVRAARAAVTSTNQVASPPGLETPVTENQAAPPPEMETHCTASYSQQPTTPPPAVEVLDCAAIVKRAETQLWLQYRRHKADGSHLIEFSICINGEK